MDEKDEKTIDAWAGALQGEEGPCAASEDMPAKGDGRFARGFAGFSWKAFFVKAVVLIGVLYAFSLMAPFAPVPVIVLAWAAVGACAAVGLGYHVVMRKAFKQRKLTEDGRIARFVNGRSASFLICSAFSMFTTASLLIGCIDWGVVQWVLAVLSVFVFLAAYGLSGKFTADEYDPVFRNEARIGISSRVVFGVIAVRLSWWATPAASRFLQRKRSEARRTRSRSRPLPSWRASARSPPWRRGSRFTGFRWRPPARFGRTLRWKRCC